MKSNYNKVRHIQESNQSLEKRVLLERRSRMFEDTLPRSEGNDVSKIIACVTKVVGANAEIPQACQNQDSPNCLKEVFEKFKDKSMELGTCIVTSGIDIESIPDLPVKLPNIDLSKLPNIGDIFGGNN